MNWVEHQVMPYLESLPLHKAEISNIEYLEFDEKENKYLVSLTILKPDKSFQKIELWVSCADREAGETKDYVVYRELTQDLPRNIHRGFYEAVIHVDLTSFSLATLDLDATGNYPELVTDYTFVFFFFGLLILLIAMLISGQIVFESMGIYENRIADQIENQLYESRRDIEPPVSSPILAPIPPENERKNKRIIR